MEKSKPPGKSGPRKFRPRRAAAAAAIAVIVIASLFYLRAWYGESEFGGPFTLTASDGQAVTERSYAGKWKLIYFGYTSCPDACPLSMNSVTDAMAKLGPLAERLQPLFITVDPERDTPAALKAFISSFDSRIVALTGTTEEIQAVERRFQVYAKKIPADDDPNSYFMNHSSYFYLLDPSGRYVAMLPVPSDGNALAQSLTPSLTTSP